MNTDIAIHRLPSPKLDPLSPPLCTPDRIEQLRDTSAAVTSFTTSVITGLDTVSHEERLEKGLDVLSRLAGTFYAIKSLLLLYVCVKGNWREEWHQMSPKIYKLALYSFKTILWLEHLGAYVLKCSQHLTKIGKVSISTVGLAVGIGGIIGFSLSIIEDIRILRTANKCLKQLNEELSCIESQDARFHILHEIKNAKIAQRNARLILITDLAFLILSALEITVLLVGSGLGLTGPLVVLNILIDGLWVIQALHDLKYGHFLDSLQKKDLPLLS